MVPKNSQTNLPSCVATQEGNHSTSEISPNFASNKKISEPSQSALFSVVSGLLYLTDLHLSDKAFWLVASLPLLSFYSTFVFDLVSFFFLFLGGGLREGQLNSEPKMRLISTLLPNPAHRTIVQFSTQDPDQDRSTLNSVLGAKALLLNRL